MGIIATSQMIYAISKAVKYIATILFLIYLGNKYYRVSKLDMDKVEVVKEMSSAWICALGLVALYNFSSISFWLMTSTGFEIIVMSMAMIAIALIPIIIATNGLEKVSNEEDLKGEVSDEEIDTDVEAVESVKVDGETTEVDEVEEIKE